MPAAKPAEVAAITYSFSKLRERWPEHQAVYDAVAEGIRYRVWDFSTLQAALVATAFADAQVHLSDALPAVVRWPLQQLIEDPKAREALTLDELRYLTHACAHIQGPVLSAEEVEVICSCAARFAETSEAFPNLAHLAISLLRLPVPVAAKASHQQALRAVCVRLQGLTPHRSAHPLPLSGMAPVIGNFLAQEKLQSPPPLTPPVFGDIMLTLVLISRVTLGAMRRMPEKAPERCFGFDDWMELAPWALQFCQAHSSSTALGAAEGATQELPGWAALMLGHIVVCGRLIGRPVQMASLRRLLQLLRRYRPNPSPDAKFYTWASQEVVAASQRGFSDRNLLAKLVGELVPKLPDASRTHLAKVMMGGTQETMPATTHAAVPVMPVASARILFPAAAAGQPWSSVQVTLAAPASSRAESPTELAREPAARSGDLWNLLHPVGHASAASTAPAAAALQAPLTVAALHADAVRAPAAAREATSLDERAALASSAAVLAPQAAPGPDLGALTSRLELALERISTLEARLQRDGEQRPSKERPTSPERGPEEDPTCRAEPAEVEAATVAARQSLAGLAGTHEVASPWPVFGGWAPVVAAASGGPAYAAMLHVRQPFSFDDFRRAESKRLQVERQRRLMPPDHIPCFMFPKKQ